MERARLFIIFSYHFSISMGYGVARIASERKREQATERQIDGERDFLATEMIHPWVENHASS